MTVNEFTSRVNPVVAHRALSAFPHLHACVRACMRAGLCVCLRSLMVYVTCNISETSSIRMRQWHARWLVKKAATVFKILHQISYFCKKLTLILITASKRSLRQVYVFTPCLSVILFCSQQAWGRGSTTRGKGICTQEGVLHPGWGGGRSPRCYGIRSMCRRYSSCWNSFFC